MPWAPVVVAGIGAAASLYQQYDAKKQAEKVEKENRRQAAWNALMQAAAGGTPQNDYQARALPQIDYAGAINTVGSAYANSKQSEQNNADQQELIAIQRQRQLDAAAAQQQQADMQRQRIGLEDARVKETIRSNKATENNAWYDRTGRDLDRRNEFEKSMQQMGDTQDYRNQLLQIQKMKAGSSKAGPAMPPDGEWLVRDDRGQLMEWDEDLGDYKPKFVNEGSEISSGGTTIRSGGTKVPANLRKWKRKGGFEPDDDPLGLRQ